MRKLYLLAVAALIGGSAFAENVTVGISRPLVTEEPRVYDDFSYITTADFNKSVDGLTVQFYQSPELEKTLAVDKASESGYAPSSLRYRGAAYTVDYVWKIQCADYAAGDKETKGGENYTFGFDLTVADGKTFTVSALDLDLLIENNPSFRIRIINASNEELFNSSWNTDAGAYNSSEWGYGWGASFTTTASSLGCGTGWDAYGGKPLETLIPSNLVLTAGTYKVLCDVDYNNENVKGLSFDHLTIEGVLGTTSGISSITTSDAVKNGAMYNLAGQRISAPVSGQIYIQNGKKYIKK